MDIYLVTETQVTRQDPATVGLPDAGFLWLDATHDEVCADADGWRDAVERITGVHIVDPHLIDAANLGHPSYFDSTQDYEMVVFRKLAVGETVEESGLPRSVPLRRADKVPTLANIATMPVTFFLMDHALVTVSGRNSRTIDQVRRRLLDYRCKPGNGNNNNGTGAASAPSGSAATHQGRPPGRPEDLMLRLLNAMVDRYLELRQPLTDQLDRWQRELLDPRRSFNNWSALLDARIELRKLENLCEEQHDALQEFRDNLVDTFEQHHAQEGGDRRIDVLMVRVNDVMEHVTRVLHHAARLQDSIESAIQLHFSATAHRTNEIVRTLTVITAIFAPLTLITGIFGMNFEFMPLLKHPSGFWLTMAVMAAITVGAVVYFRVKRIILDRPRER